MKFASTVIWLPLISISPTVTFAPCTGVLSQLLHGWANEKSGMDRIRASSHVIFISRVAIVQLLVAMFLKAAKVAKKARKFMTYGRNCRLFQISQPAIALISNYT